MILLAVFTGPVFGEETERERLVRIETKLDTLIESSKLQNDRLTVVERRVEVHGTWWGVVFAFMGITTPVVMRILYKEITEKRPPLKPNCQEE